MSKPESPYGSTEYEDWGAQAPPPPRPRRWGCFFGGCLLGAGMMLLLAIGAAVVVFRLYTFTNQVVSQYSEPTPREIPVLAEPEPVLASLDSRMETFQETLDRGEAASLSLSAEDLNALIADDETLRGHVFVRFEDGEVRAQVSVPLERLKLPSWVLGGLTGRFLNGEATVEPGFDDKGQVVFSLSEIEIGGERLPDAEQARFGKISWDMAHDPRFAAALEHTTRFVFEDDALVIQARDESKGERDTGKAADEDL